MTENIATLFTPLTLPNGSVIPNRLCKAAMEENLCDAGQVPGRRLFTLYEQWAKGGAGLILTGNVMISPDALTGPGGVVLQDGTPLEPFQQWARSATSGGAQCWMQINHPGRQVYAAMGEQAVSPSDVTIDIAGFSHLFSAPKALTQDQIEDIIERFANTAALAEKSGFTGVQIHAAHGYLLSQFLSPLTNRRTDQWGGDLANRARLLFTIVDAVRARVDPTFCVAVKLNSADFQKGGFTSEDAKWVVSELNQHAIDLVELSGGSYESPAMQGSPTDGTDTSLRREAYFIDFAREIASVARMPIMATGGIRRRQTAIDALSGDHQFNVQMLGVARAMAFCPSLPNEWLNGTNQDIELPSVSWKNKTIAALAMMAITKEQLSRVARGRQPKLSINPIFAVLKDRIKTKLRTRRYRAWRSATR